MLNVITQTKQPKKKNKNKLATNSQTHETNIQSKTHSATPKSNQIKSNQIKNKNKNSKFQSKKHEQLFTK